MLKFRVQEHVFEVPRAVFTVKGNPWSEAVVRRLKVMEAEAQDYRVFDDAAEVEGYFESGVSRSAAVAIFDHSGSKSFTHLTASRPRDGTNRPPWAAGVHWAIQMHTGIPHRIENCASQIRWNFLRRFEENLGKGWFPWGKPRKNESAPRTVSLPEGMDALVARLNDGPNLRAAIAAVDYALELPAEARISWCRVVPEPAICDESSLWRILTALREFERATSSFVRTHPECHKQVLAGVHLADGERLRQLYLHPPVECFSVGRPDLHYTGSGLFASEIDEMPGGFPELAHIDNVYGVNRDRWQRCFDWLTGKGPLLFLVSHEWSKPYLTETRWLVEFLKGKGYPVSMVTTDQMGEMEITAANVRYRGEAVGTIWRQFPIFETAGQLIDLVAAAETGAVRLVPEFAHFGNKVWFSLFWRYQSFFQKALPPAVITLLEEVLPRSTLVEGPDSFPCAVAGQTIHSLDHLRRLSEERRNELVLKICGANPQSARSYGVLMGHGLSSETWQAWIDERVRQRQPFIVQERVETAVARLAVKNISRRCAELFDCRLLLRPWVVGEELVSVHGCAVPRHTLRVHGRVDMAVLPVEFGTVN